VPPDEEAVVAEDVARTTGGRLVGIHVAADAGAPMIARDDVRVVPGRGLEGDRYAAGIGHFSAVPAEGGGREVTLIAAEALAHLRDVAGLRLDPGETRRNLTTDGVDLDALVGRRFAIGEVELAGVRPCPPCGHLDAVTGRSLRHALQGIGGLRANVVTAGTLRVGDRVVVDVGADHA
jgi:MOSC domain-containing protein YiiM